MQLNQIIGVIAPTGSGKSFEVTKRIFLTTACVAIYDPQAARDMDYRMAASHIVEYDLKQAQAILAEDNFQLLFRPIDPVPVGDEYKFEDFSAFIKMCYRRCELIGPMTLIVDEAHFTCSKRTMPYDLLKVTTMSRSVGLDVVWITQKFSGVNTWMRGNAHKYWIYRLASPGDLDIVAQVCGAEVADRVVNLRRLEQGPDGTAIPGELLVWSSLDGSVVVEDLNASKTTSVVGAYSKDRLASESSVPEPSSDNNEEGPIYEVEG